METLIKILCIFLVMERLVTAWQNRKKCGILKESMEKVEYHDNSRLSHDKGDTTMEKSGNALQKDDSGYYGVAESDTTTPLSGLSGPIMEKCDNSGTVDIKNKKMVLVPECDYNWVKQVRLYLAEGGEGSIPSPAQVFTDEGALNQFHYRNAQYLYHHYGVSAELLFELTGCDIESKILNKDLKNED
jgi:hypothetical protein